MLRCSNVCLLLLFLPPLHSATAPQGNSMSRFAKYVKSAIPQYDRKFLQNVTPERCAELCIGETQFVCRSFDYKRPTRQCWLSDKNTNDVPVLDGGQADPFDYYERIDIGRCKKKTCFCFVLFSIFFSVLLRSS